MDSTQQHSKTSEILAAPLRHVLNATRQGVECLQRHLDLTSIADWTDSVAASKGRVVLCGMGKSGLIAQKISATFASTGTPSFFLHPAEALHGDLGMVTAEDMVLILSNSGESEEIVRLLPSLVRLGVSIGAITAKPDSSLGKGARWVFTYELPEGEGCPLNFAPMASTTLQLLWGDLLAVAQMTRQGFTLEGFAVFHPAGSLGAMLMKTNDLMHKSFPRVDTSAPLLAVLAKMTEGRLGMTTVMDGDSCLGVVSDGDIRRALERSQAQNLNPLELTAVDIMTRDPISISTGSMAVEAARTCESRKITFLLARDPGTGRVEGVLHLHDLLQAKVI